jgi:hypothetical protein
MAKFHISKDGVARQCRANGSCPLGGEDSHFPTKEEAQAYSDKKNAEKFGVISMTRPEQTKPAQKTKDKYVEPKFEDDFYKYKYRRQNSDWRQTKEQRKNAIQWDQGVEDLYYSSSMGEVLRELERDPDGPIYQDKNSWKDMMMAYFNHVDNHFYNYGGAPDYNSDENLQKVHIEAQRVAFQAGIRRKPGVTDEDIANYYSDKGFELAPQTKEEYDEMNRLHDELKKAEVSAESAPVAYEVARNYAKKVNIEHEGLFNKVKNIGKIFSNYDYAYDIQESGDADRAKIPQLKENKENWHKSRKTDPITHFNSRLDSYNKSNLKEVVKGVTLLKRRHGFSEPKKKTILGVQVG